MGLMLGRGLVVLLFIAASVLSAQTLPSAAEALEQLPRGHVWLSHVVRDLLPWWMTDTATGAPEFRFPSTRCDDGSLYDEARPCPEIRSNSWINPRNRYLVSLSRQTYVYGVLFHLTGDTHWLRLMRAGVEEIRGDWMDRENGGMFTEWDAASGTYGPRPAWRDPQQMGYGLLGMAFYYYLTRDGEALRDLLELKHYIISTYYDPELGALRWMKEDRGATRGDSLRLTAQLDQMNAYMVLLAPLLDEPDRTNWINDLRGLSWIMLGKFYNAGENLFFLQADRPEDLDPRVTGTDFGHTIKALWMIRMTAQLAGDEPLEAFAASAGLRVLERAYLPASGSWAQGIQAGGALNPDKSWWIYCELDQFAASLALAEPAAARYLSATQDYWLKYFVDARTGEVWNGVAEATRLPITTLPKQWQWKNGYHSLEHALVSYITARQLAGEAATLYFAFPEPPPEERLRPYFYRGKAESVRRPEADDSGIPVWEVQFSGIK